MNDSPNTSLEPQKKIKQACVQGPDKHCHEDTVNFGEEIGPRDFTPAELEEVSRRICPKWFLDIVNGATKEVYEESEIEEEDNHGDDQETRQDGDRTGDIESELDEDDDCPEEGVYSKEQLDEYQRVASSQLWTSK